MRGLDPTEWEILVSASYPDPCDEEIECEDESVEEMLAVDRLVSRGLVVIVPCIQWPNDRHPELTASGRTLLLIGRVAVVGS